MCTTGIHSRVSIDTLNQHSINALLTSWSTVGLQSDNFRSLSMQPIGSLTRNPDQDSALITSSWSLLNMGFTWLGRELPNIHITPSYCWHQSNNSEADSNTFTLTFTCGRNWCIYKLSVNQYGTPSIIKMLSSHSLQVTPGRSFSHASSGWNLLLVSP